MPAGCREWCSSYRRLKSRPVHTALVDPALLLRVLGPLRLERGGREVHIGGARQREVLARLTVARGRPVGSELLLTDVWGRSDDSVAASLHVSISKLRRAIDPDRELATSPLVSTMGGYALHVPTDADEMEELARRASRLLTDGAVADAEVVLRPVAAVWRGDPYEDVGEHAWLVIERRRCEELRAYVAELYAEARLRLRPVGGDVVLDLTELVARHPARERLAVLLSVALYREQRQEDALAVLRETRRHLLEESGLDPGPDVRRTEELILAQQPDPLMRSSPPAPLWDGRPDPEPPLLGRGRQRAILDAAAAAASAGEVGTTLVLGEAGIGKTRLTRVFAADLEARGWQVAWAHGTEEDGAPALWPWVSVMRQLARASPLDPELAALVEGSPQPWGEAAAGRWRQAQRIGDLLEAAARDCPLLVVLDDLHWTDPASQALLVELTDRPWSTRLLIVVTSRRDSSSTVTATLGSLTRLGVRRIVLEPLTDSDVRALAAGAGVEVDARALRDRTGGNPFVLNETLAYAAESGSSPLDVVPASVADVLGARIARLPAPAEEVLMLGSVLGSFSDPEGLAELGGLETAQVDDGLDAALRAGLLVADEAGTVSFRHDLVRETAYRRLGAVRRARLHARALAQLEQASSRSPTRLAIHASRAGPAHASRAVRWAIEAAEQSARRHAPASALTWWRAAYDSDRLATDPDDTRRMTVLLGLVDAQLDAGDAVRAIETRSEAIETAAALGDPAALIGALTSVARSLVWLPRRMGAVNAAAVQQLERALVTTTAPRDRCRLLSTLAVEIYAGEQRARCEELTEEAVRIAEGIDEPDTLAFALNARIAATAFPHRERERAFEADRLVDLGRSAGLPSVELAGHQFACRLRLQLFEVKVADGHADRARSLAAELRLPLPELQQTLWDCSRRALAGDVVGALGMVDAMEEREWPWWERDAMLATVRLTLLLRSGDLDGAATLLDESTLAHPGMARDARELVDLHRGRHHDVGPEPEAADDWTWLAGGCIHAQALVARGDRAAMETAYERLLPASGMIAATGSFDAGPVDRYLADLAGALGRPEEQQSHRDLLSRLSAREGLG